jgi:hypothetical protein
MPFCKWMWNGPVPPGSIFLLFQGYHSFRKRDIPRSVFSGVPRSGFQVPCLGIRVIASSLRLFDVIQSFRRGRDRLAYPKRDCVAALSPSGSCSFKRLHVGLPGKDKCPLRFCSNVRPWRLFSASHRRLCRLERAFGKVGCILLE